MRYFIYIFSTLIVCLSSAFAQSTYSGVDEKIARTWGEQKGAEILNIITNSSADKYAKLDNIVKNDIDIPYIAKFVVGKYWNKMSPEQKETYEKLFERYLLGIYKTFPLPSGNKDIEFNISTILRREKYTDVLVPIKINNIITTSHPDENNDIIDVIFRIHNTNSGIKLSDLQIAGSSLLITYRNKIYDLILKDEEEIDWFLEDFETWIPSQKQYIEDMDSSSDFE